MLLLSFAHAVIKKLITETYSLVLLPTFSTSVIRTLEKHMGQLIFITDSGPQLAVLLVTRVFFKESYILAP